MLIPGTEIDVCVRNYDAEQRVIKELFTQLAEQQNLPDDQDAVIAAAEQRTIAYAEELKAVLESVVVVSKVGTAER